MPNKRINIFTGHFGSGKTEVAVNYAGKLAAKGKKCAIVDFDIVNPYFRTIDARKALEARGVKVVTPLFANTNVDIPALPAEIYGLFENREYHVIFDVGGDDVGARALARYDQEFSAEPYEMFFVVNIRRPGTDTAGKIEEMIGAIQASSKLKVTSLVNNTNLQRQTTLQDILDGQAVVEEVAGKLHVPVSFISGYKELLEQLESAGGTELFYLNRLIRLPWEE